MLEYQRRGVRDAIDGPVQGSPTVRELTTEPELARQEGSVDLIRLGTAITTVIEGDIATIGRHGMGAASCLTRGGVRHD